MEYGVPDRNEALARLDEVVAARAPWSVILRKGEILRIIDLEGRQSVDTLIFSAHDTTERYSAQDTVRVNGSPYIGRGSRLISNDGGVLATVVADTCGRHDTSAGACSCESNTVRFGHHTGYMHACRENFVVAAAKHGLTKRDIVSNINFFMNVPIRPDGGIAIDDGVAIAGSLVELQAEMDVIVLVSNCPQVNNPCNGFEPTPVRMLIWPPDGG
jgi:urea carboxylase-associated protein 1